MKGGILVTVLKKDYEISNFSCFRKGACGQNLILF